MIDAAAGAARLPIGDYVRNSLDADDRLMAFAIATVLG